MACVALLDNKYVFFDIDGTLSEYRYDDKVFGSMRAELGCQSIEDYMFGNLFSQARPVKTMQAVIKCLDEQKLFILGHIMSENEAAQKKEWLSLHYPTILKDHIFLVSPDISKSDAILTYCKRYYINKSETVLVDDRISILQKAEENGITAYHSSSFMF